MNITWPISCNIYVLTEWVRDMNSMLERDCRQCSLDNRQVLTLTLIALLAEAPGTSEVQLKLSLKSYSATGDNITNNSIRHATSSSHYYTTPFIIHNINLTYPPDMLYVYVHWWVTKQPCLHACICFSNWTSFIIYIFYTCEANHSMSFVLLLHFTELPVSLC